MAALCHSPSETVLSQLVKGDQITDAYSTVVLTNTKQAFTSTDTEHCLKFHCRNPQTECALFTTLVMCLLQLKLLVIVTPGY